MNDSSVKTKILLGISGSVAAVKGPELALTLSSQMNAHVVVLLTQGGEHFWNKAEHYNPKAWKDLHDLKGFEIKEESFKCKNGNADLIDKILLPFAQEKERKIVLFRAHDEWKLWDKMEDPVLHILLREWADIAVIAPLSAHTLAKISNGLCDDTLSCIMRAWDFGQTPGRPSKPLLVAPAMNTSMWDHPLTKVQLDTIKRFFFVHHNDGTEFGDAKYESLFSIAEPQVKLLACGDTGRGAMCSVHDIVTMTQHLLRTRK